ncbi:MAG: cell division protein ZapD [Gammaproteobacteria bacterium]|nr:cell division protein ZapD [Gammaproteobacteria bacterium]
MTNSGSQTQAYELPLNERIRTLMRLESLFERLHVHADGEHSADSRAALGILLEIMAILGRGDLRSEVLKEMDRQGQTLGRLKNRPGIDHRRLESILESLEKLKRRLDASDAQVGRNLKQNEFLSALKQRTSIPGGTCGFDMPTLEFWLSRPAKVRQQQLEAWMGELDALDRCIRLLLMLLRESAAPSKAVAEKGLFQQSLDSAGSIQLLRVLVPSELDAFPEISGGKHRFTVRFLTQEDPSERPRQFEKDVSFGLVVCQL